MPSGSKFNDNRLFNYEHLFVPMEWRFAKWVIFVIRARGDSCWPFFPGLRDKPTSKYYSLCRLSLGYVSNNMSNRVCLSTSPFFWIVMNCFANEPFKNIIDSVYCWKASPWVDSNLIRLVHEVETIFSCSNHLMVDEVMLIKRALLAIQYCSE